MIMVALIAMAGGVGAVALVLRRSTAVAQHELSSDVGTGAPGNNSKPPAGETAAVGNGLFASNLGTAGGG